MHTSAAVFNTNDNNKKPPDSPQSPARLCNNTYAAFKRGTVVRGILCPSMTNSFRQPSLEKSYLTYTHRQRQKSLIIVNVVDLILKIVLAFINIWQVSSNDDVSKTRQVVPYVPNIFFINLKPF